MRHPLTQTEVSDFCSQLQQLATLAGHHLSDAQKEAPAFCRPALEDCTEAARVFFRAAVTLQKECMQAFAQASQQGELALPHARRAPYD